MSGSPRASSRSNLGVNVYSKFEEPVEIEGCTLWELHGDPREAITDPTHRSSIPIKTLRTETQCPVCLMNIKKAHIVMECLHRFCGECIEKSLRLGKKECPSCRVHVPSRRSLRADPNFDNLIKALYGNVDELDEEEAKETEAINKQHNFNNALTRSTSDGIQQQAIYRKKNKPVIAPPSLTPSPKPVRQVSQPRSSSKGVKRPHPSSSGGAIGAHRAANLISFVLRRHPKEATVDRLEREYIRTSCELKIEHLKKFLGIKLNYSRYERFEIVIIPDGKKGIILDGSLTLENIRTKILDSRSGEFVLHFKVTGAREAAAQGAITVS